MKKTIDVPCRFGCKSPAVGIFYVKEGCICWPDPVQALCMQHFLTAESEGEILEIISYDPEHLKSDPIGTLHHIEAFLADFPGNSVVEKAMNVRDTIAKLHNMLVDISKEQRFAPQGCGLSQRSADFLVKCIAAKSADEVVALVKKFLNPGMEDDNPLAR